MLKGIIAGVVLVLGVGLIFTKDYIPGLKNHGLSRPIIDKVDKSNQESEST